MIRQDTMRVPLSNLHIQRAVAAGYVRDDVDDDVREAELLVHYGSGESPQGRFLIYRLWNEDGTGGVRLHVFEDRHVECFTIEPDAGAITGTF